MTSPQIGIHIMALAKAFLDLNETRPNAEWAPSQKGKTLHAALERVGWQEGWPYCMAACEACWRTAYADAGAPQTLLRDIATTLSPSCMASWTAAQKVGWTTRDPALVIPGTIFIMRKGMTSYGHAGIVVRMEGDTMHTIEANTTPDPSTPSKDREGDGIYLRTRSARLRSTDNAFGLIGWIIPPEW